MMEDNGVNCSFFSYETGVTFDSAELGAFLQFFETLRTACAKCMAYEIDVKDADLTVSQRWC
jgi:hypothetical protein